MATKNTSLRQCIEEISAKNTDYKFPEQAINQAESLKSLSSDLYTDNIRFIYELIQNADDAQAKNIILTILEDKYFLITHDGKSFDKNDLQGLCGVNNGTKKKDLDKTGYKGLGFKAVFGKSDYVIIYSNGEYFRFDSSYQIKWNKEWGTDNQQTWEKENDRQFIYPWQINPIWTNDNEIPNAIQNFLRQKKNAIHVAYTIVLNHVGEIHSAIEQLKQQPYMFLFLRNISQMAFLTQSNDVIGIEHCPKQNFKRVYINKKIDSQWIINRTELDVPGDVQAKLINDTKAPDKLRSLKKAEIFFAAKYKDPILDENGEVTSGGIEKLRDQDSILFSYLPTKILDYKFPVLINANFLTNVNREQIHTDSPWNQWLFEKIGSEIFQWIKELVREKKFRFQAYRLIPLKLNLIKNILSKQFNESLMMTIQNCNFILNRKNQLLKVNEMIMDSTTMSKQSSFINIDSMRSYVIDYNRNRSFQCAEHPFIDYDSNLSQIGVMTFTWNHCIDMFKSNIFLQTHSPDQNKRMIEYFHCKYPIDGLVSISELKIEQIPFLMDQNNHLQTIGNIYFPAETIGDSGTSDSDHFFIHKSIFNWLNDKSKKEIKQWLQNLGVEERTDLTFLRKTIIPNASTYCTHENALKTIKMLFMLFQKRDIEKKELNELRKVKLLTTRGTLVTADQCFFSDQYIPSSSLEEYLKLKEDKFLSFDYVISNSVRKAKDDLLEWRRFFLMFGVQEDLHSMIFRRKLTSYEAIQFGFNDKYLSRTLLDEKHSIDAFSGLATITFMQHTQDNYHFAKFFWSYVIQNIEAELLTQNVRVYWGHSNKRGAIEGNLIDDSDYIHWFVKTIKCIPTTTNICHFSWNIFVDTKELKDLCGQYMSFSSIPLPQDKTSWQKIFHFKTKLSVDDYFDLLDRIRNDQRNFKENLHRIQSIYHYMLKEMYFWSSDEQETARIRVKSVYLLNENDQWILARDLYLYAEDNGRNNNLNDAIPCLKLDYKNRTHPHLNKFLDLFNIKQIKMNDLKLADTQSSPAEHFRRKLIEISPFLKNWLKNASVSFEIISTIDKKIQQENDFIESTRLQLHYHQQLVGETNVYFDSKHKQLYARRPWDSETTFIDLPNKLCLLLNIQGFEKNIRFLLKGTIEEIQDHFKTNSIEIPTKKDIVILQALTKSDLLKPPPTEPHKSVISTKNEETTTNKPEMAQVVAEKLNTNSKNRKNINDALPAVKMPPQFIPQHNQFPFYHDSIQVPIPIPFQEWRPRMETWRRTSASVSLQSEDEQFDDIEVIDLLTITPSNLVSFESSSDGIIESESLDTGLIGEQMVYRYLLNRYREDPSPVNIKWLNQIRESHLPYDILLTKDGKNHYIEVKSTRTCNQHIFPLSINQIEFLVQQRENYFIYRVYTNEKKIIILDNIRWRLKEKQQLVCLLKITPKSSD